LKTSGLPNVQVMHFPRQQADGESRITPIALSPIYRHYLDIKQPGGCCLLVCCLIAADGNS
jgi:hypothetical protein